MFENWNKSFSKIFIFYLFLIYTAWGIFQSVVPLWDGSDFILVAMKVANSIRNDGILDGLKYAFENRGWRPVNLPILSAPFFFLFENHVNFSLALIIGLQGVLFYTAFSLLYKENDLYEWFFPAFLIMLPWVFNFTHLFLADQIFILAGIFSIAFISRSIKNSYKSTLFLLTISLIIFFTSRPAEAGFYFLFSVITYYIYSKDKKIIYLGIFSILLFLLLILSSIEINYFLSYFYKILILSCIIYLIFFKFRYENKIISSILTAIIISFIWFFPKRAELYDWVYSTSFGALAQATDTRSSGIGILGVLKLVVSPYGIFQTSIATLLAVAYFIRTKSKFNKTVILAAIASFIGMVFAYRITGTGDERRILLPIFIFYLYGTSYIFKSLNNRRLSKNIVIIILFSMIFFSSYQTFKPALSYYGIYQLQHSAYKSPDFRIDSNKEFALVVKDKFTNHGGKIALYSHCYFDGLSGCSRKNISWPEPAALNVRLLEMGISNPVHFKSDIDFNGDIRKQFIQDGYQYILIDSFINADKIDNSISYSATVSKLLDTANKKTLEIYSSCKSFYVFDRSFYLCDLKEKKD